MNNEKLSMNVECDITGSIESKNNPMLSNDITRGKISGIYKIINKINGKYYVGSSSDIKFRWKRHIFQLSLEIHKNDYLQHAWNKHGKNMFDFVIIETVEPNKKMLHLCEQKYLDIAKSEQHKSYNLKFKAVGGNLSEYSKKKLSLACGGVNNGMFGKHHTDETKIKISLANTGRVPSMQEKLKAGHKGHDNHKYNHRIYTFINHKSQETYTNTMYNFYTKYKLNQSSVSRLVCGKIKSTTEWILL